MTAKEQRASPVQDGPGTSPLYEATLEAAVRAVRAKLPPGAQFGPQLNVMDAIEFCEVALTAAAKASPPIPAPTALDDPLVALGQRMDLLAFTAGKGASWETLYKQIRREIGGQAIPAPTAGSEARAIVAWLRARYHGTTIADSIEEEFCRVDDGDHSDDGFRTAACQDSARDATYKP